MLRGHLELSGDMVSRQLPQIGFTSGPVFQNQIIAQSRSDKDLFNARQPAQFFEQFGLAPVIGPEGGADLCADAGFELATPPAFFAAAFETIHIGRRPAGIADDAAEGGVAGQFLRLPED